MKKILTIQIVFALLLLSTGLNANGSQILAPAIFSNLVARFDSMEDENVTNAIPNAASFQWLQNQIPLFDCPDADVQEIYYYRWWSFRKHLVQTPAGFLVTEFLTPVRHAGIYNTISCAVGFHIAEERWLHDDSFLENYASFWLHGSNGLPEPHFHKYSSWIDSAIYDAYLVTGDKNFTTNLLGALVKDYSAWELERRTTGGLFWQFDVRDGMEESISGSRVNKNLRPTINSYMFANARAIADIARLAGDKNTARDFYAKAEEIKKLSIKNLWNEKTGFFEVLHEDGSFSGAREELGFIPWMFGLPPDNGQFSSAWSQLTDPTGFSAPFGITTAERRHPKFRSHGVGKCEWDGSVWPFATSQTLVAMANVIRDYGHAPIGRSDYLNTFLTYTHSQHSDGKPYIGEYLDEKTGKWINGANGRSRYYNHSTYADLVITGLVGIVPRADDIVQINPLLPEHSWDWFCLDDVKYHGHTLTVLWDKDGSHYNREPGLTVFADGKAIAHSAKLKQIKGRLP